jgi:hypothetical protein
MAFSNLTPVIQQLTLQMLVSISAGQAVPFDVLFQPQNFDGTGYDFTNIAGATLFVDNAQTGAPKITQEFTVSYAEHDTGGLLVHLTSAQVEAIAAAGSSQGKFTLVVTDGVNSVIVAAGSFSVNSLA